MGNFHYLVAGLPDISTSWKGGDAPLVAAIEEIHANCSKAELKIVELMDRGLSAEGLDASFYREAASCRNSFVRDWFAFDLAVRNAKVRYLNSQLGRPADKDVVILEDEASVPEFAEAAKTASVLASGDILSRERGLDDLYWAKASELTTFDYFNLNTVLAFLAKASIIRRWLLLDEETGRELFKKLVEEVRGTFSGVKYEEK
ncbi:MAG: DUF2764 family protein [Bacteroidales bacterium]|nr:DUF2764 family protein [Bacteroidales bacterium]